MRDNLLETSVCLLVFFTSSLVTKKSKSKAGADFWFRSKGFVSPLELQSNWTGGMEAEVEVLSLWVTTISSLESPLVLCLVGSNTQPSPEANIGTDGFLNYKKDLQLVSKRPMFWIMICESKASDENHEYLERKHTFISNELWIEMRLKSPYKS